MQWTAERFLKEMAGDFGQSLGVELEFSILLSLEKVEKFGRFCLWIKGDYARQRDYFSPIGEALKRLQAPQEVLDIQKNVELSINQGIAVSLVDNLPSFRFYLHAQKQDTLANYYSAWRWSVNDDSPQFSEYSFHFFPETVLGQRPLDFVDPALSDAFSKLLEEERLRQGSGFWLRQDANKKIEQIDLALPWTPLGSELQGLNEITKLLKISPQDSSFWQDLPIRHVATKVGAKSPSVTLYSAAPLGEVWPVSEIELQQQVRQNSQKKRRTVENLYSQILPLPTIDDQRCEMDYFYGGDIAIWKKALGEKLHYHAGFFDKKDSNPDDAAMAAALDRAVKVIYPFIPKGGRIYDIGCGWGGPLAMFIRDLRCPSLGLTVSKSQCRYIASLGLPVRWGDAEKTTPPGYFNCITLIESFCHILDKERLLRILKLFTDRLIIRVNCQDASLISPVFGGSMHMVSSTDLRKLLELTGWKIIHWQDRRQEAMPSVIVWNRRLKTIPLSQDRHLEVFRNWTSRVLQDPESWAQNNPLIEVVVDKV